MANLRFLLAAEVALGNRHTSKHSSPRLWALLDGLAAGLRPWLIPVMREAERRHQHLSVHAAPDQGASAPSSGRWASGIGRMPARAGRAGPSWTRSLPNRNSPREWVWRGG
jgi:hypothetical protein